MNKERIVQCEDALRRSKEFIALDILEQLEKENRIIEDILIGEQIEIDRLKKENEQLKQKLIGKENEFKYFPNSFQSKIKELKEENEHIRRLLGTAIIVLNRIENPEVPYEKMLDNLRKLKELLGSVE